MPSKKDRFAHVGSMPIPSVAPAPQVKQAASADPFEVSYSETVQLNVNMSPALRTAIRAKALRLGVPVTVALKSVLERWLQEE